MKDEVQVKEAAPAGAMSRAIDRPEVGRSDKLQQIIRELEAIPLEKIEDVAALDELEAGCLSCS